MITAAMLPFRIVTFNIAHGRGLSPYQGWHHPATIRRNLRKIALLLERLRPDVVALQEVDEDSHWNGRLNLLAYLQEHTRFPYGVLGVNTRREGRKPLCYGNGLLSRHRIAMWENVSFSRAEIGGKGFLFAELDVGRGHVVPVVNLHLAFASRKYRLLQAEAVTDYLTAKFKQRGADWLVAPILCGDPTPPPRCSNIFRAMERTRSIR